MLIESLIRRKNGTTVTFGKPPTVRTYKFAPTSADPRHTCDVENEDDIGDLLAIKEGYRIAKGSTVTGAAPAASAPGAPSAAETTTGAAAAPAATAPAATQRPPAAPQQKPAAATTK